MKDKNKTKEMLIEELKALRNRNEQLEEQYYRLVEMLPNAVVMHQVDGKIICLNSAGSQLVGAKSPDEVIGKSMMNFVHDDFKESVAKRLQTMLESGETLAAQEEKFVKLNGAAIDVEVSGSPLSINGKTFVLVVARDITERKRAEELLKNEQRRLYSLLDSLPVHIYLQAQDHSIPFANKKFKEIYGELKDKLCYQLKERTAPCDDCITFEVFKTKQPIHRLWTAPNGRIHDLYDIPFFDIDGTPLVLEFGIDITERKQAEKKLRVSEERLSKTFNATPAFIGINKLTDGTFIEVNKYFLDNTGYQRQEVIGRAPLELQLIDKENFELFKELFLKRKPIRNLEMHIYDKWRKKIEILSSLEIIDVNGEPHALLIANDVTELKKLQQEIARLDRLNLIGEMATGIAHEIRNPMTTVRGLLQILGNKDCCKPYCNQFEVMIDELDRANSIINEYLSLARISPTDLKYQDLNQIIESIYPLIQADAFESNKYVETSLGVIPKLNLNGKEIHQLLLNLVRNALEAMDGGGKIELKTYRDGDQVVMAIKDQGNGISDEILGKIGTPFFTTKTEGTGLGLAICYSIASRHNANINIRTSSEGTTFYVHFKTS